MRLISQKYSISAASIHRHKRDHLGASLIKAKERRELAHGGKVLLQVEAISDKTSELYDIALELVKEARDAKDRSSAHQGIDRAIALLREARATAGLIATITGDLGQAGGKSSQVAILVYPPGQTPGASCDLSLRPKPLGLEAQVIDVTPLPPAVVEPDEVDRNS